MENNFVELSAQQLTEVVGGQTMNMPNGGGKAVWWKNIVSTPGSYTSLAMLYGYVC